MDYKLFLFKRLYLNTTQLKTLTYNISSKWQDNDCVRVMMPGTHTHIHGGRGEGCEKKDRFEIMIEQVVSWWQDEERRGRMRVAECLRQTVQFELWSVVSPYLDYSRFFPLSPHKGEMSTGILLFGREKKQQQQQQQQQQSNKEPAHRCTGTHVICVFWSALIVGHLSSERKAYNLTTFLISCPAVT